MFAPIRARPLLSALLLLAVTARAAAPAAPSAPPSAPLAGKKIALLADPTLSPTARHGIDKLRAALRAQHLTLSEDPAQLPSAGLVLLAGVAAPNSPLAAALAANNAPIPATPESLTLRTHATYQNKPAILLAGADDVGLMYAALDLADRIGWTTPPTSSAIPSPINSYDPFQFVQDATESPALAERGVVMFTMNRAYFESHLLDEQFLTQYFDMLAKDRFNRLVLVFGYEDGGYMAPLYPYFFDVPGFPDVKVVDQTPQQQARNLAAMKTMIRLATERGIHIKPGIWDHIYRAGIQNGAIPGAWNGRQPASGFVWGLDEKNLVPYTVAALKKFYETFPEFTETQFRMHEESGLRRAEIEPFWHEVFNFFKTTQPHIKLEFRLKNLPKSVIADAQSMGLPIQLDTKIWMEQMGLPYHPSHINREDQSNARQSYADFLVYPQTYHMNWTLWNGGTTRELLWADPDYVRRIADAAHLYDGQSLIITEMQATKMLGAPHDEKPYDFLNDKYRYTDYEFERYWDFYQLFGRLSYDPQTAPDVWQHEYAARFGPAAGPHVMNALHRASTVLPHIVAASVPYSMFPTTTGWPEMMHLGSLPQYARTEEGSDIAQFMNVRDDATSILQHTDTAMRRPEETSRWFSDASAAILAEAATAEKSLGGSAASNEFKSTLTDVKMLAALARYHAARQLGGVNYNLYKQSSDTGAFDEAIKNERDAVQAWHDLVDTAGDFYVDTMWFGPTGRNFPHHWKDEMKSLDTEFQALLTERQAATAAAATASPSAAAARIPARDPNPHWPTVTFTTRTPAPALPGHDFPVQVTATAANGIKSIRLRYRHLNQTEDYQSLDMTPDPQSPPQTGRYTATIPAAFITPQWDLMYFAEIIDQQGNGRIYPDLDVEQPYVIAPVKR